MLIDDCLPKIWWVWQARLSHLAAAFSRLCILCKIGIPESEVLKARASQVLQPSLPFPSVYAVCVCVCGTAPAHLLALGDKLIGGRYISA